MALVTTTPINAVVAHIMQEKQGEYGLYQSVLFESPALQDGKLWRALKPTEAQQLRKGQTVELTPTKTRQGKDSWNIRLLDNLPARPTPPHSDNGKAISDSQTSVQPSKQQQTIEDQRKQIEAFIFSMANLHAVCYQAAEQAYAGQNAPDGVIRAATSSRRCLFSANRSL